MGAICAHAGLVPRHWIRRGKTVARWRTLSREVGWCSEKAFRGPTRDADQAPEMAHHCWGAGFEPTTSRPEATWVSARP